MQLIFIFLWTLIISFLDGMNTQVHSNEITGRYLSQKHGVVEMLYLKKGNIFAYGYIFHRNKPWMIGKGTWNVRKSKLHLKLEVGKFQAAFSYLELDYYSVEWGERRYLIPPRQIKAFCDQVEKGLEPRSEIFGRWWLLRLGDEHLKVDGVPELCR